MAAFSEQFILHCQAVSMLYEIVWILPDDQKQEEKNMS